MAHYALLDDNNMVTWVITGNDETFVHEGISDWEEYYGSVHSQRCLRTSYNTHMGQHLYDGEPFRGNFAGIGYTYDEDLDAFIPAMPTEGEWALDADTFSWVEVTD